jgi:hypothetical protein
MFTDSGISGTIWHPLRHVHPYALFEALNHHCAVAWNDEIYHGNTSSTNGSGTLDYSRLSGDAILALGAKERGVIATHPPVYPFLRLNEYRGTAGLGLLMNCSSEEDLGILGSDLYFHAAYHQSSKSQGHSHGSFMDELKAQPSGIGNKDLGMSKMIPTSPTTNYFTICSMPVNTFQTTSTRDYQDTEFETSSQSSRSTEGKNAIHQPHSPTSPGTNSRTHPGGPYHPACSLSSFTPPPIQYVAAVHFQSMGSLRSYPHPRSALWFYLLAHDALFRQCSPKRASWLAQAGLCLNKAPMASIWGDIHQHYHRPSNMTQDSLTVGITGGVLNSQLRLLLAQAKLVAIQQRSMESDMSDHSDDDVDQEKIQVWIDLAHRELILAIGANHPLLMRFYQMLAGTFWFLKQWNKSVEYQRRAVEMSLRGLGKVHAWSLRALLLLGSFCLHTGDIEQALHAFRECLQGSTQGKDIGSTTGITDPIFLAEVHYALSEAYLIYGDLDLALQHALSSQQMKEAILGTDHPFTINAYYQVAEMALSSCQSVMSMSSQPSATNSDNQDSSLAASQSFLWDMNKIITKTMSKNAQIALQCYEKIFQFVKYQAATQQKKCSGGSGYVGRNEQSINTNDANHSHPGQMESGRVTSPVRLALYAPISSKASSTLRVGSGTIKNNTQTINRDSNSAFNSKTIGGRQHTQQRLFQDSIGTMCSLSQYRGLNGDLFSSMTDQEIISSQLFDLTRKLLWLYIILTTPMRRDNLRRILKKSISTSAPAASPGSLKAVIVKLIAYSPVHYLDTLMDKIDNARGDADLITEAELVAIFTLLEMQQCDSIMMSS